MVCMDCASPISRKSKTGRCRSCALKALNADPEFAAQHSARHSAKMKARHADPEFAAQHSARMKALNADPRFNPLVGLTEPERRDYDKLKKAGYTRADALRSIGRGDLFPGVAS